MLDDADLLLQAIIPKILDLNISLFPDIQHGFKRNIQTHTKLYDNLDITDGTI